MVPTSTPTHINTTRIPTRTRNRTRSEGMNIPSDPRQWRVGLVGYGEVGRILAEDLRTQGVAVAAYDVKLGTAADAPLRQHASQHTVSLARSHTELASQADFIVSAVTASQTVAVAESCAPAVKRDAFFLDFNSASPGSKITAADRVEVDRRHDPSAEPVVRREVLGSEAAERARRTP